MSRHFDCLSQDRDGFTILHHASVYTFREPSTGEKRKIILEVLEAFKEFKFPHFSEIYEKRCNGGFLAANYLAINKRYEEFVSLVEFHPNSKNLELQSVSEEVKKEQDLDLWWG